MNTLKMTKAHTLKFAIETFEMVGFEAKMTKNVAKPLMLIRNPNSDKPHQKNQWWTVTPKMFKDMEKEGIKEAFDRYTLLGDIFSVPVKK